MISWLLNKLGYFRESIDDLDTVGSQQGVDTEAPQWMLQSFGIVPPHDLQALLELYLLDDLAHAIIDSLARLAISDIECVSEEDELAEYINEFNRKINLYAVLYGAFIDCGIFGFGVDEIVGNGSSLINSDKIIGIKRHDPRFFSIRKNRFGRIAMFIQRPGFVQAGARVPVPGGGFFERNLEPETTMLFSNVSPSTVYGVPDTWAIRTQLKRRSDLLDSAVIAARNHANPTIHAGYVVNPEVRENQDEVDDHRNKLKKSCQEQQKQNSKYIVTAGKGNYTFTPIGQQSLPDITNLIDTVTASAIIASGLNPASLGYSLGKSGVTSFESSDKLLASCVVQKQRAILEQLHTKLYPMLQVIDPDCPKGEIIVRMKEPTAESVKEKLESDSILINNVERRWRHGSLTADGGARLMGDKEIVDKEQWEEWKNSTEVEANPNDPNVNQSVDKAVRSVSRNGKSPSNNPSGRKESNNGNSIRESTN